MSNLLRPYNYWESDGQYFFDTPSGARYVAYFLDLSSFAENLYTFNFDRSQDEAIQLLVHTNSPRRVN